MAETSVTNASKGQPSCTIWDVLGAVLAGVLVYFLASLV